MNAFLQPLLATDGPVVTAIRTRFSNAMVIYAFGSQMQGTAGPYSDLDLALLVAGYADPLALWDLAGDFAGLVGTSVDLLDLRAASTVMQHQVITTGQCLWSAGVQTGLFECYVQSEKTALNTARAALVADIKTQGHIYGR